MVYDTMFHFIKEHLEKNSDEGPKNGHYPFRTRSDHIQRVFMWSERLVTNVSSINKEAVLVT